MNPHQVDAALFALKSPFAKGVLLADEVGLGKTIEAGLVMSQRWAERRRRVLLVVPASLRKQWQQELFEKFSIRAVILDAKTYGDQRRSGIARPFEAKDAVVIVSYEFAARKADDVRAVAWDLVVFDEAHRLRNVHKKGAKRAKVLKEAVDGRFKILLTATPLQNSLTELYGIVSMIDEMHFGGENAFKAQYMGANATPASQEILRERLKTICHRTLRRQVQEAGHINFRQRHAVTFQFEPHDVEADLYEQLSAYLQDPDTIAYGGRTNALVILQARKSLGSSTAAVAGYLDTLLERLRRRARLGRDDRRLRGQLRGGKESLDDEDDETEEPIDPIKLAAEIAHVESMRDIARGIGVNGKGEKLIANLPAVLDEIEVKGGQRKAVIFTESVRTQHYINQLLAENGYAGRMVLMNGSNNDPESRAIYEAWKSKHAGTDRISGSKTADMKAAIVEAFRGDDKTILIATESGAEGINLQFCSLLINYDLPWNPQRVEQRIGRCHRYGQLVDVTVVNMLKPQEPRRGAHPRASRAKAAPVRRCVRGVRRGARYPDRRHRFRARGAADRTILPQRRRGRRRIRYPDRENPRQHRCRYGGRPRQGAGKHGQRCRRQAASTRAGSSRDPARVSAAAADGSTGRVAGCPLPYA
ncbi:DEAD/DEAH box helicase [Sphingomonas sp. WKB10]|nr:DEAD/DEAH box helicase [Sphingomonas sp. WKB10]